MGDKYRSGMHMARWNRSQKYHARVRVLYALLFPSGHCYIGQTVDPKQREAQHRSAAGGWYRPFQLVILGSCHGTQEQASDHERAWRLAAVAHGWQVYAKPPGIVCNPARQASFRHHALSHRLRWSWPRRHSRKACWRIVNFFRVSS